MGVPDYSTTAASNSSVGGVNVAEGMKPGLVNNALRAMMADLAAYTRQGSNLASAATLNLDSIQASYLQVTGTTTVTAVTLTTGHQRIFRTTGALPFTCSSNVVVNQQTTGTYTATQGELFFAVGSGGTQVLLWSIGPPNMPYHAGGTDVALADGGTGASLADPNADRLLFWDDSGGAVTWLTPSGNLSISTTTMTSAGTHGSQVLTTSGTTAPFTGIPSGVNRIVIMFAAVSTNGNAVPLIQIGDSGGYETTGYNGSVTTLAGATAHANHSTGFALSQSWAAAVVLNGFVELVRFNSGAHSWAVGGSLGRSDTGGTMVLGGNKTLSAELDRVQIITTDAFDAGAVNIFYSY